MTPDQAAIQMSAHSVKEAPRGAGAATGAAGGRMMVTRGLGLASSSRARGTRGVGAASPGSASVGGSGAASAGSGGGSGTGAISNGASGEASGGVSDFI